MDRTMFNQLKFTDMRKILFSVVPETLIVFGAWCYAPALTAVIVTAVCVFVSVCVYKSLE